MKKINLILIFAFLLLINISFISPTLTDNLLGYWNFDEGSGNTITDSANNYDANAHAIEASDWITGKINNAMDFDGTPELANTSSSTDLGLSANAEFTANIWVNVTTLQSATDIFTQGGGGSGWTLNARDGSTSACVTDGTTCATQSSSLSTNTWHMITGVYNGTGINLYIDGSFVTGNAGTSNYNTNPIVFARHQITDASNRYLIGALDEAGFWARDLSSAEITELYNSGNGLNPFGTDASPSITITNPSNETIITDTHSITLSGVGTDDKNLFNISVYLNNTKYGTNSSPYNNSQTNFTLTLSNGIYNWYYEAYDNNSQKTNSNLFRFNVSITTPPNQLNITLTSPENYAEFDNYRENQSFISSIISTNNSLLIIQNVSLLINGSIVQTKTGVGEGYYNFSQNFKDYLVIGENASFSWTIQAYGNDSIVYNALNGTLRFNVKEYTPFQTRQLTGFGLSFSNSGGYDFSSDFLYLGTNYGGYIIFNIHDNEDSSLIPSINLTNSSNPYYLTEFYNIQTYIPTGFILNSYETNRTITSNIFACNDMGCIYGGEFIITISDNRGETLKELKDVSFIAKTSDLFETIFPSYEEISYIQKMGIIVIITFLTAIPIFLGLYSSGINGGISSMIVGFVIFFELIYFSSINYINKWLLVGIIGIFMAYVYLTGSNSE